MSAQTTVVNNTARHQPWVRAVLLAGLGYVLIGRFPVPATHVRAWRLAAWLVSGVVFAAHIGYEYSRLRSSSRFVALHTALAVAIGGFGLALVGALHSVSRASASSWVLALVLWPLITGVPAFLAAFAIALVLSRLRRAHEGA